jgi:hypothetical protein
MIINNLNIDRSRGSLGPIEANPPFIINADAVLVFTVAFERFETATRQRQNGE